MTPKDKKKYSDEYVRVNRALEKKWFPRVKKALDWKISSLIDKIKSDGIDAGIRYLNMDIANARLTKVISDLYESVGLLYARKTETRLRAEVRKEPKKSIPVSMEVKRIGYAKEWIDFIQTYLRMYMISKITFRVAETTRSELLKVLNEAINEGWGVDEIVSRLKDLPFTAYQAARIVRTEINRASNVGVHAQGQTFEYELMKSWISVQDTRTRGRKPTDHADHYHMNDQTVDFDGKFKDPHNGHELTHPGDPEASAADVINCRCNMYTIAKRDANGRLIPKQNRLPKAA